MDQTALPFEPATASALSRLPAAALAPLDCPIDSVAFEIGRDHAHHRLTPPVAHLHADNPVRLGWQAGRAVFGRRTLKATPAVRQWLALRLQAWQHGWAFEDVQVTPNFLARIAATHCPVTGEALTADNAAIVRLREDAACAAGNLVMLSATAAHAKAGREWQAALQCAEQIESGACDEIDGLAAPAWRRLALLISFVTPLPASRIADLPLVLMPPARLRVLNALQALQVMLTLQFAQAGYARRLVTLAALMPSSEARHAFQVFMHTALEAVWADTLAQRRWQRLALLLTPADAERLLARAASKHAMVAPVRWLTMAQATEGWALESAGRATDQAATRVSSDTERPGNARSRASQKLAS
ncbi:MAG: hypothetical protein HY021_08820 [Burkholderiales bacterium]|nr:hypothetical protein [Burkholderiales bacterium]